MVAGRISSRKHSRSQETTLPGLTDTIDATLDEQGRDTVKGTVRLALDITESLSEGVPFLPGAVKALKTVVEAYEVRRSRVKVSLPPFVECIRMINSALHARIMRVL